MISKETKIDLEKQGYRFTGKNSATKVCEWCKKALKSEEICYKGDFYGIQSWRCVQMSPTFACTHRCIFCWRNIEETDMINPKDLDSPKEIIDNCIKEHVKFLQGFGGNEKRNKTRYKEAQSPLHFAISLIGEPCLYPKLPELINEIKKRNMTSFVVTNGTQPEMLKKLLIHQPTQLYMTLPAPNKEVYDKTCNPLINDGWERINKSLSLLDKFDRSCIRLTLVKNVNMVYPEQYAELIKKTNPDFVELKAYMWVGHSRNRLEIDNMPYHHEIRAFAEKIVKKIGWKIIDEKPESRTVLMMKNDNQDRILKF
ncbi:4-demethylwyosine synthase TYW1 [Candidatus Woesearchaeota archaeon]|nr:4-demethylwyosine synthase TYW1 [Candidatus Woesearchaeota archaeon]